MSTYLVKKYSKIKRLKNQNSLFIKSSFKGRGVFVNKDIKKGTIIEKCPLILLKNKNFPKDLELSDYVYHFTKSYCAIALGFGSLYNHSSNNNAYVICDHENCLNLVIAKRNISKNEEIFINYGYTKDFFEN